MDKYFTGKSFAAVDNHTGEMLTPIFGSLIAHDKWVEKHPITKDNIMVCVTFSYTVDLK
jgi:hypothetical protein